jgi:hypothetical protein
MAGELYKAMKARVEQAPKRTQVLLINLDARITDTHDSGYPTSQLTEALDELWEHLIKNRYALALDDEELRRVQEEAS